MKPESGYQYCATSSTGFFPMGGGAAVSAESRTINRPLRVLRVIDRLGYGDRLHGAGRVWLNSLGEFGGDCQIIPCVLRLPQVLKELFSRQGIALQNLNKSRFDPTAIISLCRLISAEEIDVLHLEGFGAFAFGRIAGLLTGTPVIVHLHDRHGCAPWYVRISDWCLAPATARAIAVSGDIADVCVKRLHIRSDRVVVVPNAIRRGWAQPIPEEQLQLLRAQLGIPLSSRIIGTVAHLQAEKDIPTLIGAAALLEMEKRDCNLVVVGEGPDRQAVEEQVARLGIASRVHLVGFKEDVRPYLALMEVVVFSSIAEGCPNTLLEAMAIGRPIVATEACGIKELVQERTNGLLASVGDPQSIARAIQVLLDDRSLASRLSMRAKQDAERFQMPAHIRKLGDLYRSVISRR